MKYLLIFKTKPYITGFVVILLLATSYFIFGRNTELDIDFALVSRGNLVNEINVTGRVKAAQEVDLGFEKSGRISSINAKEGGRVLAGQVLISLENGGIVADLDKAKANLKSAEAVLAELKRGSRREELNIQETKILNAENSLKESKETLLDEIKRSFTTSDDAIRNKVDLLFSNPRSYNPKLIISSKTPQLDIDVQSERILIEEILNSWKSDTITLTIQDDLIGAGSKIKENLVKISNFLDKMALIVNSLESSSSLSQATIDTYQLNISTARVNIDTARSNLSTDNDGLVSSNSTLGLEKKNLELMIAGTDPQKILSQEASVEAAKADVKRAESELRKTLIISPISGIVTNQEARVGEIIGANTTPVSVISDNLLQVEVNVPESDVVLISVGNTVRINLDAYDDDVSFSGKVVSINPAEIVLQGVPAYKTIVEFDKEDERIRPGMTADIFILAQTKENVLNIGRRAVLRDGSREYVRMMENNEIVERDVKTGFKSSDGRIEIISGLEEGEEVIVFFEEK